ncbi:MAG: hypothetical protein ACXWQ6_02545 [Candidatus Limnocylindrales bacterium]
MPPRRFDRDALRTIYPKQRWGPLPPPLTGAWGFRVQLEGGPGDAACEHCTDFRGWLYDPHDAPLLPMRGCTRPDGCTCRYA